MRQRTDGEEPDEDDSYPASRLVRVPGVLKGADDSSHHEVAYTHSDGARDECGLASPFVDVQHRRNCCKEHDNSDDPGCQEGDGVSSKIEGLEDEGCVVENEVYACPLLE